MKNLILLMLLAAGLFFGWRYLRTPTPHQPTPAPSVSVVEQNPAPGIPFHLRLKIQRLIEKYEDVLVGQGAGPVQQRTRDEFAREVATIKRDLQRMKIYDSRSLHAFCLQAASEIDTNGDGQPDYAPEQANHLINGILGISGY